VIPLNHFLILGALLFAIGVVGIFMNRKNLIVLLMAIELMLLAVNMNFVAFSPTPGTTFPARCSCSSSSRWPQRNRPSASRSWWRSSATCARSTWTTSGP
jgi:hypothetical protein